MIDFYTWNTPNGQKVAIMLAELDIDHTIKPIDISKGDQFAAEFLKINPNNKIPAIIDQDGPNHQPISIFESGAILIYLAEKTGKFLPSDLRLRVEALQWLMFQMGGVGPMFGQLNHFLNAAPTEIPYAIERYSTEVERLYKVMNGHLANRDYFAQEYSIADMAIFPWVNKYDKQGIDIDTFPHVKRFIHHVGERPAVKRAMAALAELNKK